MKTRVITGRTPPAAMKGFYFLGDLLGSVRMDDAAKTASQKTFVPGDWFQLAKTGTFFSPVYGKISITPQDLANMFRNFKTKTPLAPTQLPIDYDHLSDEPAKPEDGKAAGWVQDLQIRDGGQTLWCQPKWTKRAAELISNGEYRFVSPYFLTDYLDKASGKKIGPTLKAVAITNRPFLEGMEPIPAPAIAASERLVKRYAKDPRVALPMSERPSNKKDLPYREKRATVGTRRALHDSDLACPTCGAPVKH